MGYRTSKGLEEQVIVITGASSGIGLCTARMAAEAGAAVVMAARHPEVESLARELRERGARAEGVIADVSQEEDIRRIAELAVARFEGIDTWVNNAGTAVYGRAMGVPIDAARELFETNFWGVVYGSRAAVAHMCERGGTLINVGSIESDRAAPLQSLYAASKHAVKAFTDALRMELDHDRVPVQVTLLKPAAIDTPFFAHARSYAAMGAPKPPPPVYAPEVVARALLDCASRPCREVTVGGAGRAQVVAAKLMPGLADRLLARGMFESQFREAPHDERVRGIGQTHGDHDGPVLARSAFARARTARVMPWLAFGALALVAGAWARRRQARRVLSR